MLRRAPIILFAMCILVWLGSGGVLADDDIAPECPPGLSLLGQCETQNEFSGKTADSDRAVHGNGVGTFDPNADEQLCPQPIGDGVVCTGPDIPRRDEPGSPKQPETLNVPVTLNTPEVPDQTLGPSDPKVLEVPDQNVVQSNGPGSGRQLSTLFLPLVEAKTASTP